MRIELETLAILLLGFSAVILFSLAVIITLWVKVKRKAFAWFLVQLFLLIAAFIMIIGSLAIYFNPSKAMSLKEISIAIGIVGVLWALSMISMLIGIIQISRQKVKVEELSRDKLEYNPSLKNTLGMLTFYILLCPLIPLIITAIASKLLGFSFKDPLVYFFTTFAQFGLLILWLKRKYIINLRNMFSMKKTSVIFLIPMTLTIIGLGILLSEASNFITRFIPMSDFWLKVFNDMSGDGFAAWKGFLASAVAAPVVEEIIFRGMVLRGFLKHYSVRKSILLSALLFGLVHMNLWQFVGAFAAGIILGWWYIKTESIVTTIFGHALNNSMSFIIGAIGVSIPGYNAAYNVAEHQPVWFDLVGIVLLLSGIVMLVKLFNTNHTNHEAEILNAE